MMSRFKSHRVFLSMVFITLSITMQAQDPQFAQYYNNPMYLNPAMAGLDDDIYFGLNYRSQWKSLELPFEIVQASAIIPILEKGSQFRHRGGLGMMVYRETAGESENFKTTAFTAAAAYNLFLKEDASQMISVGLQGGIINKQINFTDLRWGSQYNPFIGFDANITPSLDLDRESATFPVFHAGIVWYFGPGRKYYQSGLSGFLGFAASNLNQPDESLLMDSNTKSPLPRLYKVHGGINLELSQNLTLSPNVLIMAQHQARQFNTGLYFTYEVDGSFRSRNLKLQLGTWYRWDDAIVFSMGLVSRHLGIGVSYDFNNSTLRSFTGGRGALEASISYRVIKGKGLKRFSTPLL